MSLGSLAIQGFKECSASSSELLPPVSGIIWFHKHLTPISSLMSLLSIWCYVCVSSFHKDIELDLSPYFTMTSSLTLSFICKTFSWLTSHSAVPGGRELGQSQQGKSLQAAPASHPPWQNSRAAQLPWRIRHGTLKGKPCVFGCLIVFPADGEAHPQPS